MVIMYYFDDIIVFHSHEFHKMLREMRSLLSHPDVREQYMAALQKLVSQLKELCLAKVAEGETLNPVKLIQIHLKHTFFQTEKEIRGLFVACCH